MENINNNHSHEGNSCDCDECGGKRCGGMRGLKCGKGRGMKCGGASCVYFLAFIGAAVYYIQLADTFWMGTLGILKALVWPAMVVYNLMGFLGM